MASLSSPSRPRTAPVARTPWTQTRASFLGTPVRTPLTSARYLQVVESPALDRARDQPLPSGRAVDAGRALEGVTLRCGGTRRAPQLAVYAEGHVVASYDGDTLVVAPDYRRRGIGLALVVCFRTAHPDLPPAAERNRHSQALMQTAHRELVARAVADRRHVPAAVLADYPELARRAA